MKEINYYDKSLKDFFSHPEFIRSLLFYFMPELRTEELDLKSIEYLRTEFTGIRDKKRECDLLVKFSIKNQFQFYVYILLEFQSTNKKMNLRILEYLTRIYKQQQKEYGKLHPVVPIVFYTGSDNWSEKPNLENLFSHLPEYLRKFVPEYRYFLLEINKIPKDLLLSFDSELLLLIQTEQVDFSNIQPAIDSVIQILEKVKILYPDLFTLFADYISGFLLNNEIKLKEIDEYIRREEEPMSLGQNIRHAMKEQYNHGKKEGKSEGKLEGKLETARLMLNKGFSVEEISVYTGLSIDKIQLLNNCTSKNK